MTNNLMIASSCHDRLAAWTRELNSLVSTTLVMDKLDTLGDVVTQIKPKVMLLDYDLLGSADVASLRGISKATKIIVIGSDISEETEWQLLKAGVRGCCRSDADPKLLKQVVMAVHMGELWIRRTLTCRLIDELGRATAKNKVYRDSLGMLNKLTQREYDIAVRVKNGESNKLIAKACGITERTVKAHLTEVFNKLGVTDRLNLALVLSADERATVRKTSSVPLMGKHEVNRSAIASQPSL
ncbi:MAG: response regulator transcription factor [Sideroxyarcus sp.]|nr:response regulator transcription factor [Sideroxyarcus sp.]